jgi:hypothetical protein
MWFNKNGLRLLHAHPPPARLIRQFLQAIADLGPLVERPPDLDGVRAVYRQFRLACQIALRITLNVPLEVYERTYGSEAVAGRFPLSGRPEPSRVAARHLVQLRQAGRVPCRRRLRSHRTLRSLSRHAARHRP